MKFLLLFAILTIVGCVSPNSRYMGSTVSSDGKKQVSVRYLNAGMASLIDARRAHAISNAKQNCGGGRVEFISENISREYNGDGYNNFIIMTFQCLDQNPEKKIY